jgi:hypothetical protein
MWMEEQRRIYRREGGGYPSDLRDAEFVAYGLPMRVVVYSAAIQDRDGAGLVLDKIRHRFPPPRPSARSRFS